MKKTSDRQITGKEISKQRGKRNRNNRLIHYTEMAKYQECQIFAKQEVRGI